jgi:hypothetical protein
MMTASPLTISATFEMYSTSPIRFSIDTFLVIIFLQNWAGSIFLNVAFGVFPACRQRVILPATRLSDRNFGLATMYPDSHFTSLCDYSARRLLAKIIPMVQLTGCE